MHIQLTFATLKTGLVDSSGSRSANELSGLCLSWSGAGSSEAESRSDGQGGECRLHLVMLRRLEARNVTSDGGGSED